MLARTDGSQTISTSFYTNGYGTAAGANYATPCGKFDLASYPNAVIRVTMGSIVDYFQAKAAKSLCDMLTTQNSFSYAPNADGPWVTPAYYPFGLGGSQTGWPMMQYGAQDQRAYVSFWGGNVGSGTTGGCCYASGTKGAPLGRPSWGKPFSVDLLMRPGTQTRTATVVQPASGTGAPCPELKQTQNCVCAVNGGWTSYSDTCSASCNGGFIFRSCTNPPPSNGGSPCTGRDWAYCSPRPCSPSAGVVNVILHTQLDSMTSGDVFDLQTKLRGEVAGALNISQEWVSVLNIVPSDDSISISFGLDSSNPVIGSGDNEAMTLQLSDAILDGTSAVHLPILYPTMAQSTLDSPAQGPSGLLIAEVTLGCVAGFAALVFLTILCGRMYRHYRDEKEAKWSGESKQAKPVANTPTQFDLNKWGSSFAESTSRNDSVGSVHIHGKTPSFDQGGLNMGSYGYTNPVANAFRERNHQEAISVTVAPVHPATELMRVPSSVSDEGHSPRVYSIARTGSPPSGPPTRPPSGPPVPPRGYN